MNIIKYTLFTFTFFYNLNVTFASKNLSAEQLGQMEKSLIEGEIVSRQYLSGSSFAQLLTLKNGYKCVFKKSSNNSEYGNHHAEVATYRLAKILGLEFIPPTVFKKDDQEVGSCQLYIEEAKIADESMLTNDMKFFDKLIGNWDRSFNSNFIYLNEDIYLIDNGVSFQIADLLLNADEIEDIRPSYLFYKKLNKLNLNNLKSFLGISDNYYESFLKRRDYLLILFQKEFQKKKTKISS